MFTQIKTAIIDNKYKIVFTTIGYCLFILDSDFLKSLVMIIQELSPVTFWSSYVFTIISSFFVSKYGLNIYKKAPNTISFYNVFNLISLGSLFGFFTTLVVSYLQISMILVFGGNS